MKHNWTYKKLGEVADIYQPKTLSTEMLIADGKYLVYGANGVIGRYSEYNHEKKELLVTCRGATCGTLNVSEPFSWINGNAMVVHISDNQVLFDFLKYVLKGLDWSLIITGAAQPQITRQNLAPTRIPIPSLEEQQAIVRELDGINRLIDLQEEQLREYDRLAQSLFYTTFGDPVSNPKGWEVKKLSEIVSPQCTLSYGIVQPGDGVEEGVPVVRPVDLIDTFVGIKGLKKTTVEIASSYKRTVLTGHELLMCVRGTIGIAGLALEELSGCNVTRGITPILFQEEASKWLVFHIMKTEEMKVKLAELTRGIALKGINMADVRKLPIIYPPLPLQQTFAAQIEAIEQQKALVRESLNQTRTLLASRMQYYFE